MTDETFSQGFLSPGHPSELAALEYSYPADYTAGMRREILHSLMSPIDLVVEIEKIQLT